MPSARFLSILATCGVAIPLWGVLILVLWWWYGQEWAWGKPDVNIVGHLIGQTNQVRHGGTFWVEWSAEKVYHCPVELQKLLVNSAQVDLGYRPRGLFGSELGPYSYTVPVYVGSDVKPGRYQYVVDAFFWCNPLRPIEVRYEGPWIEVLPNDA